MNNEIKCNVFRIFNLHFFITHLRIVAVVAHVISQTPFDLRGEEEAFRSSPVDASCVCCVLITCGRHQRLCGSSHPPTLSPSVRSQVNSDKIYWQRKANGTFGQIYSEKNLVGHFISTKAVGSDERHDITHLYKHAEGTKENTWFCRGVRSRVEVTHRLVVVLRVGGGAHRRGDGV